MSRRTRLGRFSRVATPAAFIAFLLAHGGVVASCSWGEEPAASDPTPPTELPEHLRALQQRLGGSVVDQFDSLRPEGAAPGWWKQFHGSPDLQGATMQPPAGGLGTLNWGATWGGTPGAEGVVPAAANTQTPASATRAARDSTGAAHRAIVALREVAAQLDQSANRLESMELYHHADALRKRALQMRLDARRRAAATGSPDGGPIIPAPQPAAGMFMPPSGPVVPVPPQFSPAAPAVAGPPQTSATGAWHLHWVGPPPVAPSEPTGPTAADEPGDAPVWSEDRDSADRSPPSGSPRREPGTIPR